MGSIRMKFIMSVIAGTVGAFIGLMIIGALVGPKQSDPREQACKEMMQDSAPGAERRMTREMCKRLGVNL